jgi:hypothetical protein
MTQRDTDEEIDPQMTQMGADKEGSRSEKA